ncbi:MAG: lytic transglycosylase domain-containing protein [Patescibacteria group bacterium]|nr:lytic transglycosylase domain-containing protein [Patescibacteria group bacterium]
MKKNIVIFRGVVCVLAFAAFTVKCAVDFADKVEKKQEKEIAQIKKDVKESRELITIFAEEPLNQDLGGLSKGVKKIVQEIKRKYGGRIKLVAQKHSVDSKIIIAIIAVESSGNCRAVSCANARGLMQLKPLTAKTMGIKNPFHPYDNIWAGTRYLKRLKKRFGNFDTALAAYNLGPTKVAKLLQNGFNPSAYKYVRKVKAAMEEV